MWGNSCWLSRKESKISNISYGMKQCSIQRDRKASFCWRNCGYKLILEQFRRILFDGIRRSGIPKKKNKMNARQQYTIIEEGATKTTQTVRTIPEWGKNFRKLFVYHQNFTKAWFMPSRISDVIENKDDVIQWFFYMIIFCIIYRI